MHRLVRSVTLSRASLYAVRGAVRKNEFQAEITRTVIQMFRVISTHSVDPTPHVLSSNLCLIPTYLLPASSSVVGEEVVCPVVRLIHRNDYTVGAIRA